MNRKLVVLLVTFLTLAPLAAHDPWGAVRRIFQLSEAEVAELRNCRAQIAPLRRELRELQGLLRELSGDSIPNPTAIGETHLRIQDLRRLIREAEKDCRLEFEMLLTDEQLRIYARIRRLARWAERNQRVISALEELNLL